MTPKTCLLQEGARAGVGGVGWGGASSGKQPCQLRPAAAAAAAAAAAGDFEEEGGWVTGSPRPLGHQCQLLKSMSAPLADMGPPGWL